MRRRFVPVVVSALAAMVAVVVVMVVSYSVPSGVTLAVMLWPGLVTVLLVRSSRARWYRWLVVWALAQVTVADAVTSVLLVGYAWCIYRSWWVERAAGEPLLARMPRRGATASAVTADQDSDAVHAAVISSGTRKRKPRG